jgi:hypothetical protein
MVNIQVSLLSYPWSWQLTRDIPVDAEFLSDKDTVRWSIRKGLSVITLTTNYKIEILLKIV